MKKIILAPAVALAFTGLVAAPVAAAEAPSAQSAEATAAEKEQAEKEKAEKEAAAKKAKEKKEAEEKAEAKKKADAKAAAKKKADEKAAEEKKAKEAADKKEDDAKTSAPEPAKEETTPPAEPKQTPEPSEDPTDNPTDNAEGEDSDADETTQQAEIVVPSGPVAAEDLADPSKGVTVTVTGLEAGDLLTPLNGLAGDSVEAAGSTATLNLFYDGNAEDLADGPLPFSIDLQRESGGVESLSGTVNVKAVDDGDGVDPIEASLTVDPKEITAEDLANEDKGVDVTVSGVKKGDTVTDSLTGDPVIAESDGELVLPIYYKGNADDLDPGQVPFTVTIDREGTESEELKGEITVVEDDDAVHPIDASLKVDPKEITAEDFANKDKGVDVTVSGVKAGDTITDSLTGNPKTATKDGDFTFTLYYKGNPDNLEPGKIPFTVTIDREGTESQELRGEITIIDDKTEAPAEASLTVSPKSIEAADFINEKKGVKLSVKDCKPGEDVRFVVTADGNSRVTAYDRTVKADKDGTAWVTVYGTSSNASAYVGSYSVTATCGDDALEGSFKVTAGSNAGGGDGGGDNGSGAGGSGGGSGDGSYLPRTGVELDGLAAGALLLLVGGAAVTITMRRKKGDFSPSYI